MLALECCRRLLGAAGEGLTDDQVRCFRDQLYQFARLAIDMGTNSDKPGIECRGDAEAPQSSPGKQADPAGVGEGG